MSSMSMSELAGMCTMPRSQAELHVLAHAHPERGHLAAAVDGGVGDLLDAVEVAGEAGRDDAPIAVLGEQRAQHAARRCVSLGAYPASSAFVESASRTRMPSVLASWPMRARSVRRPSTGVRSSLKSPECRMTPCGVCTAMAWAWGTLWVTGMNSTSNGPIWTRSPSATACSSVRPEQAGLLDAVAGQAERQRRAVDREADLAQQELDARRRGPRDRGWRRGPRCARRSRAGT